MQFNSLSVVILSFNEAPNICRCLSALSWAEHILVIDSGSTDQTVSICSEFQNTAVLVRPFDNHTNQWNFGIDHAQTPWVLCIDADYVCPKEFQQEVELLEPKCDAYFAAFRYLINGRPLKATLYPPRAVLFRKARFRYVADGHTQLLNVEGAKIGTLKSVIDHDDRKALGSGGNASP